MQQVNLNEESAENREQWRLKIQATNHMKQKKPFYHDDFMKFHLESLENNFENRLHNPHQKKEEFSADGYTKILQICEV